MCWISYYREPKRLIAKEDIPVIKVLNKDHTSKYFGNIHYVKGKEYPKVDLVFTWTRHCHEIAEGYHSLAKDEFILHKVLPNSYDLRSVEKDVTLEYLITDTELIVDFVIPKGTAYYLNEYGEYVSETIRMVGDTEQVTVLAENGEIVNKKVSELF